MNNQKVHWVDISFITQKVKSINPCIFILGGAKISDAFGMMSNGNVITPNLDKLAKSGAILTNVYNICLLYTSDAADE
mgnify:CR=1 FL=1